MYVMDLARLLLLLDTLDRADRNKRQLTLCPWANKSFCERPRTFTRDSPHCRAVVGVHHHLWVFAHFNVCVFYSGTTNFKIIIKAERTYYFTPPQKLSRLVKCKSSIIII